VTRRQVLLILELFNGGPVNRSFDVAAKIRVIIHLEGGLVMGVKASQPNLDVEVSLDMRDMENPTEQEEADNEVLMEEFENLPHHLI
jgi:hypothetical protein